MPIPVLDAIPEIRAHATGLQAANVRHTSLACIGVATSFGFVASVSPAFAAAQTVGMSDRMFVVLMAGTFAVVCTIMTMIVAALCSDDPDQICPHQDAEGQAEAAAIRQREG